MSSVEADANGQYPTLPSFISGAFYDPPFLSGYVADGNDPEKRWVVELLVDGWPIEIARADRFDFRMPELEGIPADYGFVFDIGRLKISGPVMVEIRLANSDHIIARFDSDQIPATSDPPVPGAVAWLGGLHFRGWLARRTDAEHRVRGLIDEDVVVECQTRGLTLIEDAETSMGRPAFDFHLPLRYADGRARILEILDEDGRPLSGSPISFVAYDDALANAVADRMEVPAGPARTEFLSRFLVRSMPFEQNEGWSRRFFKPSSEPGQSKVALVLVGDADTDVTLESLSDVQDDWVVGVLSSEHRDGHFHADDLAEFLEQSAGDCRYVVFTLSGARFAPGGLARFVAALDDQPHHDLAYCDVIVTHENQAPLPIGFPDFDYERLLEQGYPAWCFVCRMARAAGLATEGANSLIDMFLRMLDGQASPSPPPIHLPGFLVTLPSIDIAAANSVLRQAVTDHLKTRGQRAELVIQRSAVFPAIQVQRSVTAENITVVIAVHNESERVRACMNHLMSLPERHRLDIVIIDVGSSEPGLLRYIDRLDRARVRRMRVNGALNIARALNRGAELAQSRNLLFLDPAVELEPDVLDDLIGRAAEPSVAAVGATLVSQDGLVLSAGLILGHAFGALAAGRGCGDADLGYGDMLAVTQERSAVSSGCLLVKREEHIAVRGFDEISFGRNYFSVDYCLRLRARGRRIIVSRRKAVTSREVNIGFRASEASGRDAALQRELRSLRLRWGHILDQDPFYNPLLALDGEPFSALACPPRLNDTELVDLPASHEAHGFAAGQRRDPDHEFWQKPLKAADD